MKSLNILVGCERSGRVRDALRKLGHNAVSCDLLPSDFLEGGPHYMGDVLDLIYLNEQSHITGMRCKHPMPKEAIQFCRRHGVWSWDMAIFFPECKYMAMVGMRWNVDNPQRQRKTKQAITFVKKLLNAPIPKIALENPRGVIPRFTGIKATQEIHPYMFGEPFAKRTQLWLKNLPPLVPTKIVPLPKNHSYTTPSGKIISRWFSDYSKKKRAALRGITFKGIANAMAKQWTKQ